MANGETKLPTELWAQCWSRSSPRNLRGLTLVCRYFRTVCQPLLFQNLEIQAPDPEDVDRTNWMYFARRIHRSTLRFAHISGSAHVSSVRSIGFSGRFDFGSLVEMHPAIVNIHRVEEMYLTLLHSFLDTLGNYQNLRSLRLTQLTLDTQVRDALVSLGRLESLELITCDIVVRSGFSLPLQEFKVIRWWAIVDDEVTSSPLNIVSPEALRALTLVGHRNCGAVLSALIGHQELCPNLTTLSIELWDPFAVAFLAFLESCPQLEKLEILKSSLSGPLGTRLPLAAIPRLQSFKGPRLLAAFFVSGRPVSTVELLGGSGFKDENKPTTKDIVRDLEDIGHASPGASSFTIAAGVPDALGIITATSSQWPDLRRLCLLLKVTPPTRRFWDPDASDLDIDEEGEDRYPDEDESLDERSLHLSDDDSLDFPSFGYPDIRLPPDPDEGPLCTFDNLISGHMYTIYGKVSPPPAPSTAPASQAPNSLRDLISSICADLATFPPALEYLHLSQSRPVYSSSQSLDAEDGHRLVLALERQLPALRELELSDRTWWRYRDTWTEWASGTKIASLITSAE
ncbi:hypothetical protein B0H16DRAFT_1003023 [Mycena metata]|uniref:F-box domain-containing protein n=1 Tax=Mycena metata TaxID=1033252 RepID=A0AAD7NU57_9AGAR|nr:hypothetical protein B0H16DRAFT_1003023 [Mycena metata]